MKLSTPSLHLSGHITNINLHPSRIARKLLLTLYIIALTPIFLMASAPATQALFLMLTLALVAVCEVCYRQDAKVVELGISTHKIRRITDHNGAVLQVLECQFEYISRHYIVLQLKLPESKYQRLHLLGDCSSTENFRQLRALGLHHCGKV